MMIFILLFHCFILISMIICMLKFTTDYLAVSGNGSVYRFKSDASSSEGTSYNDHRYTVNLL